MQKIEPAIKKCGSGPGAQTVANINLDIKGKTGSVSKIRIPGVPAPVKKCIMRQLLGIKFPKFQNETMAVQYPVTLAAK
jgi:hypothetical protein